MSDDYRAALKSGTASTCRCFHLTRADGVQFGFTDHDADLNFAGVTFRAGAALTASEAAAGLGLAPAEMDASGALSSDAITEADIEAGRWDGAAVQVWDVDWRNPDARALLGVYSVGQIERQGIAFRAELRSLAAGLDRPEGRSYTAGCDCRKVGDARCRADLAALNLRRVVTVTVSDGPEIWVEGAVGATPAIWDRGVIRWLSGANIGRESDIRVARASGGPLRLSLWHVPPGAVQPGDRLELSAGCDRTFTMCRDRFRNGINFQGFPHMPGDAALTDRGDGSKPDFDGGSRFG